MLKKRLIFLLLVLLVSSVSATDVFLQDNKVVINSVSDLYSYEVVMSYSGDIANVGFFGFLSLKNGDTIDSWDVENGKLIAYESRLDNNRQGVSGDGELFYVDSNKEFSIDSISLIYANGSEENLNFVDNGDENKTEENTTLKTNQTLVSIVPDSLNVDMIYNNVEHREFLITNLGNTNVVLKVVIEGLEGVSADEDFINLNPGEEKKLDVEILGFNKVPQVGRILLEIDNNVVASSAVLISTKTENFPFDISLSLKTNFLGEIKAGDDLVAQVDLTPLGNGANVIVYSDIKDLSGNSVFSSSDALPVIESVQFKKVVDTNGIKSGEYVFSVQVVSGGEFTTASKLFEIISPVLYGPMDTSFTKTQLIFWAFVLGIFVLIVAVFLIKRKYAGSKMFAGLFKPNV